MSKKDLKEALGNDRKPDITHVRLPFMNYVARGSELGDVRYERGNYLRHTGEAPHTVPTAADFRRLTAYMRASVSHAMETLHAMELHRAHDPDLQDVEGMRAAAYAPDTDQPADPKHGPSQLAHLALAASSLQMAICQAVECGLLPRDPGTPWKKAKPAATETCPNTGTAETGWCAIHNDCGPCSADLAASEPSGAFAYTELNEIDDEPGRCRIYDTPCINPAFCNEHDACCAGDPECQPSVMSAPAPLPPPAPDPGAAERAAREAMLQATKAAWTTYGVQPPPLTPEQQAADAAARTPAITVEPVAVEPVRERCTASYWFGIDPIDPIDKVKCVLDDGHDGPHKDSRDRWFINRSGANV